MLKTLVMDFLAFKPEFSRRLSRIFFSASSRLSRNFHGRLAGLAQIAAAGRLSRRLRGLRLPYSAPMCRAGIPAMRFVVPLFLNKRRCDDDDNTECGPKSKSQKMQLRPSY